MSLALLRIETRRSIGLWLALSLLALAGFYLWRTPVSFVGMLWVDTSLAVRDTIFFAGPGIAGAAAWMAGRERRRGTEELLATMPQPATARLLTSWASVTLWGLLVYVVMGVGLVLFAAQRATWGQPIAWVMIVGLLAMLAHAALGFATGHFLPGRLTAPLVATLLYFLQLAVGYSGFGSARVASNEQRAWLPYLSPVAELGHTVWYGITPNVGVQQSTFLLGLIVSALGGVALRERRTMATWGVCIAGAAILISGVLMLQQALPNGWERALRERRNANPADGMIAFTPVCTNDPLPVCAHPAYQPWLEENAPLVNRLAAPLLGLPGAPTRAEQYFMLRDLPATTLGLSPQSQPDIFAQTVANSLVVDWRSNTRINDTSNCRDAVQIYSCHMAQAVIARWLLDQAGVQLVWRYADDRPEIVAAVARFTALSPEQRRAWLAENLVALREERIPIEALP